MRNNDFFQSQEHCGTKKPLGRMPKLSRRTKSATLKKLIHEKTTLSRYRLNEYNFFLFLW